MWFGVPHQRSTHYSKASKHTDSLSLLPCSRLSSRGIVKGHGFLGSFHERRSWLPHEASQKSSVGFYQRPISTLDPKTKLTDHSSCEFSPHQNSIHRKGRYTHFFWNAERVLTIYWIANLGWNTRPTKKPWQPTAPQLLTLEQLQACQCGCSSSRLWRFFGTRGLHHGSGEKGNQVGSGNTRIKRNLVCPSILFIMAFNLKETLVVRTSLLPEDEAIQPRVSCINTPKKRLAINDIGSFDLWSVSESSSKPQSIRRKLMILEPICLVGNFRWTLIFCPWANQLTPKQSFLENQEFWSYDFDVHESAGSQCWIGCGKFSQVVIQFCFWIFAFI